MAAHPARTWLIVTGVVLLVVQAALVVCWWKLPAWAPEWVIAHSPWPEPALRALRQGQGLGREMREMSSRLLEFGPSIGPELLRQYGKGDAINRRMMLYLAIELAGSDGVRAEGGPPPPHFTVDDIAVLREELFELARLAFAEGSLDFGESASFLAVLLKDRRLTPMMCRILRGQSTPIEPEVANIVAALGMLRDPLAVTTLIPLLPIRHRSHPDVERALDWCQDDSTFPLVMAALRHEHPVVRTWAAHQLQRYVATSATGATGATGPARQVVVLSRQVIAGTTVMEISQQDGDLFAQLAQLQALGSILFRPAGSYLRALTAHADNRVRGVSIIALGELGDAAEFSVLFELLGDDDEDVARKARIALGMLPLTAVQQREVDAMWNRLTEEPEPAEPPTSPASPPIP